MTCKHLRTSISHTIIHGEWYKRRICLDCEHEELVAPTLSEAIRV